MTGLGSERGLAGIASNQGETTVFKTLDHSITAGAGPRCLWPRLRLAPLGRPSHSTPVCGSVRPPPHSSTQPEFQFRARYVLPWLVIAVGGVTQTVTAQVAEIQVLPSELSLTVGERGNLIANHLPAHIARSRCGACTCGATIEYGRGDHRGAAEPAPPGECNLAATHGKYLMKLLTIVCKYIEIPKPLTLLIEAP